MVHLFALRHLAFTVGPSPRVGRFFPTGVPVIQAETTEVLNCHLGLDLDTFSVEGRVRNHSAIAPRLQIPVLVQ